MGGVHTPDLRYPAVLLDASIAGRLRRGHRAEFGSRWLTMAAEIVTVRGEIDATNAAALTEYAMGGRISRRELVLDLRSLDFCGAEGFSALSAISVRCAAARTRWAMVPSAAVSRLLAICDPAGALPCADTMHAALTTIRDQHLTGQPHLASLQPPWGRPPPR
jgi:anti-anti-sigma factor